MKNIIVLATMFYVGVAYFKSPVELTLVSSKAQANLDYLVGDWKSFGFVTDSKGLQQYIEMNQRISSDNSNNKSYKFVGEGINPGNRFIYSTNKIIFYDAGTKAWHVKGVVKDKYALDNKVFFPDGKSMSYTFYDSSKNLLRYTISKEKNDSFTETEETWTSEGWNKTAWFRSKRSETDKTVAQLPIH